MPQSGWYEPTEQAGSTPWHTGVVEPGAEPGAARGAGPGQPLPAGYLPPYLPPRPAFSWQPSRREVRAAIIVVVLLAAVGVGVALVWWQVAPRLGFTVVSPGNPQPVSSEKEQFFATDGWYAMLTLAVGLLAPLLGWRARVLRGPAGLVALAAGGLLGAVVTWRLGLLLAPAPTDAQLQQVGLVVYPALRLRATAALMIEPIAVVVTYLLLTGFASRPDLGRPDLDRPDLGRPAATPPLPPEY
jgi:hypothetical protein